MAKKDKAAIFALTAQMMEDEKKFADVPDMRHAIVEAHRRIAMLEMRLRGAPPVSSAIKAARFAVAEAHSAALEAVDAAHDSEAEEETEEAEESEEAEEETETEGEEDAASEEEEESDESEEEESEESEDESEESDESEEEEEGEEDADSVGVTGAI